MIGVSLPYRYLCRGGEPYGDRERFYQRLRGAGVGSVEIRNVAPSADPCDVLSAAETLWKAGLHITVHGAVGSVESAAEDIFNPLRELLAHLKQDQLNITLHPIAGDNERMLEKLAAHIKERRLPVTLTLENNRLLPDKTPGDSTKLVAEAVGKADPAIVGINFDMGHFYYQCGYDPSALPSPAFLKRVKHTHIHAVSAGKTHFPLTFDLPLESYIRGLGEDYDGLYNLELEPSRWPEIDPTEALFDSIRILKKAVPYGFLVKRGLRATFLDDLADAARVFEGKPGREECCMALTQSSGYLFRTAGINWAMDIFLREAAKIPGIKEAVKEALRPAEYMVITHGHEDHFEAVSVEALSGLPMKWIIPDFMIGMAESFGLKKEQMIPAHAGEEIRLGEMTLLPFVSRHYRPGTRTGAEELGYLVKVADKKLLFPGDVRDYDPAGFPDWHGVDVLFYHLWCGDNSLSPEMTAYEEKAIAMIRSFLPKKVYISHLYEAGRTEDTMWRYSHAGSLANKLKLYAPEIRVLQTVPGEQNIL